MFRLEKATGNSIENASYKDVENLIDDICRSKTQENIFWDEEHDAFWVLNTENEICLYLYIDKKLVLNDAYFNEDKKWGEKNKILQLDKWEEAKPLFRLYFKQKFTELESKFPLEWNYG